MRLSRTRRRRDPTADITGWLLGTTIVVLAVLDVLIWASLYNVPNPISKLLVPAAAERAAQAAAPDASPFLDASPLQPAVLTRAPDRPHPSSGRRLREVPPPAATPR